MSVNESILNEHKINFLCVGNLYETDLELKENVEVRIGKKEENKTVKCKQIGGKIAVDTGYGVVTFFPEFNEIGYDGKESRTWKMATSMLDWNPKVKGDAKEPVTRVKLTGELNYYDGYNRDGKSVVLKKSYRVKGASTTIPDSMEDGFSFSGDFFVASANVNDETGKGELKLYYSNYNGEILPVECTVDADDVELVFNGDDEFEAIEPMQTRNLTVSYYRTQESGESENVGSHRLGAKRGGANKVPTYTKFVEEYVLTYASNTAIEEPEEEFDDESNPIESKSAYYNVEAVKKAKKARAQKIEEMEKNPKPKKGKTTASSLKAAKADKKFGKARPNFPPDDEAPFDTDEDDIDW